MFYTLIMCGNPDYFQLPVIDFPRSRVFEYTAPAVEEKFSGDDAEVSQDLLKFPAIFAFESSRRLDARIVRIRKLTQHGPSADLRLTIEIDDRFPPIPWETLEDISWKLQIEPFEFSRTHIAVKEVDLERAISEQNLLFPGLDSAQQESPLHADAPTPEKKTVFVCYSHADARHLERLTIHLRPLAEDLNIATWSDQNIEASEDWEESILSSLDSASAAILLVSADFLASRFIREVELPRILEKRKKDQIKVFPVLVRPSLFSSRSELSSIQAINSPSETIIEMSEGDAERTWARLAESIMRLVK